MSKIVKNLSICLILVCHFCFCTYVLDEVHNMKNYYVSDVSFESTVDNFNDNLDTSSEDFVSLNSKVYNEPNYLAILEIPKIGLKRYLYSSSELNNVDKNIEVLKGSQMPDEPLGNLILASHSGNTSIAHFHDLNKLSAGDEIMVYYLNNVYTYKVDFTYDVLKNGYVSLKRDYSKSTITLITCLGFDRQLVVVGYMV